MAGVLLGSAVIAEAQAGPKQKESPLVEIEIKDGNDVIMKGTELKRDEKISNLKIVMKKKTGSVGSSMGIAKVFYTIAKARKCEYFVNLKEWKDEDGNLVFIGGFTNKEDVDIQKEFGNQFDEKDESGQKRMLLSVSDFALIFESQPKDKGAPPAK